MRGGRGRENGKERCSSSLSFSPGPKHMLPKPLIIDQPNEWSIDNTCPGNGTFNV